MVSNADVIRRRIESLFAGLTLPHDFDAPIGPLTWYGTGGAASCLAHPTGPEQVAALLRRCADSDVPVYVLGSGANLLVADTGVTGLVIQLDAPAFNNIEYAPATSGGEQRHIIAGAGVDLAKLIMTTARDGLAGLEPLAGIPASVGGAIHMNCGGKYGDIGSVTAAVHCLDRLGQPVHRSHTQAGFAYRHTDIAEPIILGATFTLTETDPVKLRDRVKEIFAYKKSTQPLAEHSAGCTFKNPPKSITAKGAGQLIDEAGLKGLRLGGAEVSHRHANFLVLHPGGSADDVLRLIRAVRFKVVETTGIELETEIAVWGESDLVIW
ncbi:MAG: UDP-N-acetylmuramate dehydrogenase [Phycisphaeraceae bacterium]